MNRGWPAPTKGPPEWFVRARGILTLPMGIAQIGLGVLSGGLLGGAGILNGIDATGTGLAEAITGQEKPTMMQAGVDHAGKQLALTPEQKEIVDEWWYWTNLIITIGNIGKAASKKPEVKTLPNVSPLEREALDVADQIRGKRSTLEVLDRIRREELAAGRIANARDLERRIKMGQSELEELNKVLDNILDALFPPK
jgi:hypothetical protein